MVTDMWCHLTLRGAWHAVSTLLSSKYKWDTTWNSYNGKVLFSQTYNSFSNILKFSDLYLSNMPSCRIALRLTFYNIYILGIFTERPNIIPLQRNLVYISISRYIVKGGKTHPQPLIGIIYHYLRSYPIWFGIHFSVKGKNVVYRYDTWIWK